MKKNIIIILTIIGILGFILCGLALVLAISTGYQGSMRAFTIWGICIIISFTLSLSSLVEGL